jgi:hypothetical protein
MKKFTKWVLPAAVMLAVPAAALAHHSFAVFFDETKEVSVEGTVVAFRFTNPHATIALDVTGADGTVTRWRAETNAPVILQRRGWSRGSLRAGQTVKLNGWLSREGKPYMRLRSAFNSDGTQIGQSFGTGDN